MAQVFASDDAFDAPFAAAVEHRALLFPFAKRLEPAQLAALGLAAATVGDDAFLRHYEIFRALEVNPGPWMPGLLRHVLGEEHAERLMAEEGWEA